MADVHDCLRVHPEQRHPLLGIGVEKLADKGVTAGVVYHQADLTVAGGFQQPRGGIRCRQVLFHA